MERFIEFWSKRAIRFSTDVSVQLSLARGGCPQQVRSPPIRSTRYSSGFGAQGLDATSAMSEISRDREYGTVNGYSVWSFSTLHE